MAKCKHETYSREIDRNGHIVFVCYDCKQNIYRETLRGGWKILARDSNEA